MKIVRWALVPLVIFAFVAAVYYVREPESGPERFSVLLLKGEYFGTGLVVLRGGSTYIWTAAHVAFDAPDGILTVKQDGRTARAKIVACGDPHTDDLALLRVEPGLLVGDCRFATTNAAVGDVLSHCLMRQNGTSLLMWHRVTELDRVYAGETGGGTFDLITPAGEPGGSGGGLFNAKGECVGIQVGLIDHKRSTGRFIPVRTLRSWAQAHGVGHAL
jgi:S1-C subfamily serine protease